MERKALLEGIDQVNASIALLGISALVVSRLFVPGGVTLAVEPILVRRAQPDLTAAKVLSPPLLVLVKHTPPRAPSLCQLASTALLDMLVSVEAELFVQREHSREVGKTFVLSALLDLTAEKELPALLLVVMASSPVPAARQLQTVPTVLLVTNVWEEAR